MADLRYIMHTSAEKTMTIVQTPPSTASMQTGQHSPWHSPVPYLFGGLAAMLGLIAFALLILACSYWRLSGYLESGDRDLEAGSYPNNGEGSEDGLKKPSPVVFEEKFLVLMPGQTKPTCLATPMTSRASSFGSTSNSSCSSESTTEKSDEGENEEKKQVETASMETMSHDQAADNHQVQ